MNKIFIVEDDFYIRDLYSKSLIQAGYDVTTASDGETAIEIVKTKTFDMILLDIMLPKKNGIDVLREFRAPSSLVLNTPVFLITNLGQEYIIKEAFQIGADGYFLKAKLTPKDIVTEVAAFFTQQATIQTATPTDAPAAQTPTPVPTPPTPPPTQQTPAPTPPQPVPPPVKQ